MALWLIPAFALTALLYAMAGFGGGSTYAALLVMAHTDYRLLPLIVLVCNIIVTAGGVFQFYRAGELPVARLLPLLVLSAPAAWLGGILPVTQAVFMTVLGTVLLVSGVAMLRPAARTAQTGIGGEAMGERPLLVAVAATLSGFVAGIVGIGGGIFLSPVLHLSGWGSPRRISGACSLFIVINSCAGLFGQIMKMSDIGLLAQAIGTGWPLLLSVLVGGLAGSLIGARGLKEAWLRKLAGGLVLVVSGRILFTLARGLV